MRNAIFLVISILITYLLMILFFPISPTSFSDLFISFDNIDSPGISSKNYGEIDGKYCYSLTNGKSISSKNDVTPMFRDINYRILLQTKLLNYDTNSSLIVCFKNASVCEIKVTNTTWETISKNFIAREKFYGSYESSLSVKCKTPDNNIIYISDFKISCAPFYENICCSFSNLFTSKSDKPTDLKVDYGVNILKDGMFENGLTDWKTNDDIVFTNINNKSYCLIKGGSKQRRLYQSIKVSKDVIYRFSFDLKTNKNQGAFVIFRDDRTKSEKYFYCNKPAGENHFEWEFFPFSSGTARIALSAYSGGEFYFSNASLIPINAYKRHFYGIVVALAFFSIPLIILYIIKKFFLKLFKE